MGKKTKNKNADAQNPQSMKDYHKEVAGVCADINEFFRKTFSEVILDGPVLDPAEVQKSPLMFVSAHRSHVDYFIWGSRFHAMGFKNIRFAAGDNLTKLPWIGPRFLAFGAFAVSRDSGFERNYVRNLCAQVVKMIENGDAVLVFPEGGRSYTGAMLEMKGGILNAALMAQAADPKRDVYLLPAAASYECPPDAPYFPLLLKGKKFRKKPTNFIKKSLGSAYYFGADILAFAPFMVARHFRRRYGAVYMDYGAPISVRSLVDLEANRVEGARDEFAAHRASLNIVAKRMHGILASIFRILPVHVVSAAIRTVGGGGASVADIESYAANIKATAVKNGRNCKTIGELTPKEIVAKGLASLRKVKAVKVKNGIVTVRKAHLINYFAATIQ